MTGSLTTTEENIKSNNFIYAKFNDDDVFERQIVLRTEILFLISTADLGFFILCYDSTALGAKLMNNFTKICQGWDTTSGF